MKLLLLIALLLGVITGEVFAVKELIAFRRHVQARFGHKLLYTRHFMAILFGALFILIGNWVNSAFDPVNHGLKRVALEALGIVLIALPLFHNYRRTNVLYGLAGTALEVVASSILFNFILFCLPTLIFGTLGSLTRKAVRDEDQDWHLPTSKSFATASNRDVSFPTLETSP